MSSTAQTMAAYYAGQTAEQLVGFGAADVTQAELTALREYMTTTTGIPDSFDFVDDVRDLDEIRGIAPLLDSWADSLQTLDLDTSPVATERPRSDSTDLFVAIQKEAFTDTRDALLHAIAATVDVGVTRWRSW